MKSPLLRELLHGTSVAEVNVCSPCVACRRSECQEPRTLESAVDASGGPRGVELARSPSPAAGTMPPLHGRARCAGLGAAPHPRFSTVRGRCSRRGRPHSPSVGAAEGQVGVDGRPLRRSVRCCLLPRADLVDRGARDGGPGSAGPHPGRLSDGVRRTARPSQVMVAGAVVGGGGGWMGAHGTGAGALSGGRALLGDARLPGRGVRRYPRRHPVDRHIRLVGRPDSRCRRRGGGAGRTAVRPARCLRGSGHRAGPCRMGMAGDGGGSATAGGHRPGQHPMPGYPLH